MVAERITVEVAALSNSCEPLIAPPGRPSWKKSCDNLCGISAGRNGNDGKDLIVALEDCVWDAFSLFSGNRQLVKAIPRLNTDMDFNVSYFNLFFKRLCILKNNNNDVLKKIYQFGLKM